MKIIIDKDLQELSEILNRDETLKVECLAPKDINNKNIKSAEALFLRSITKIDNKLLENTKVKFVASLTSGEDHINHETLKNLDISLSSGQGGNTLAVVEYVLSTLSILLIDKKITPFETKIGIIGFGRIGQKLIKRCNGFEMKVKVFDPFVNKEIIEKFGGQKVENLEDGLKICDYVSLHVPLNEKTKNLIDYSKLKNMKREVIVINTARGGIINENDLDKALRENIIFGAGLDVFENEPIDKTNPLLSNKKVLLSPHSATFTNECKSRMSLETTKNIIDFFENKIDKSMIVKL